MVTIPTGYNPFHTWLEEDKKDLSDISYITRTQLRGHKDISSENILRIDHEGVHVVTPNGSKRIIQYSKIVSYSLK